MKNAHDAGGNELPTQTHTALWSEDVAMLATPRKGPTANAAREARRDADNISVSADLTLGVHRLLDLFKEACTLFDCQQVASNAIKR